MKYRNGIAILYILIMLGALAGLWFVSGGKTSAKRDMVHYNDEIYRIGEAYLAGEPKERIEEKFGCKIVLDGESAAEILRGY